MELLFPKNRERDIANPGPDNVWLTDDDVVYQLYELEHDARGAITLQQGTHAGLDGKFGTPDDQVFDLIYYQPQTSL